jgi:hypothetical protein
MDKSDTYMLIGSILTLIVGYKTEIGVKVTEWRANRHKRLALRQRGKPRKGGKHCK